MSGRQCGACSMCCKLLDIDTPELTKPDGEWCRHCRPGKGGCSIYADRPPICRGFQCGWLFNTGYDDARYPPRAKLLITSLDEEGDYPSISVVVDPQYPNRWREAPYYEAIKSTAYVGLSIRKWHTHLFVGKRSWIVLPDKEIEITGNAARLVVQIGTDQWHVALFANLDQAKAAKQIVDEFAKTKDPALLRQLKGIQNERT